MINLYKFLSLLLLINPVLSIYSKPLWITCIIEILRPSPIQPDMHQMAMECLLSSFKSANLKQALLFVLQHKTHELSILLRSDPSININEKADEGSTLLGLAAANGHDDIVDLLCEYGADPLVPIRYYLDHSNIPAMVLYILDHQKNMTQEERSRYEKIIWLCKVQTKMLYCSMPIFISGKGQKRQEMITNLQTNLLPVLLGSRVVNFKATTPLPLDPPFLVRKFPSLPQPKNITVQVNDLPPVDPLGDQSNPDMPKQHLTTSSSLISKKALAMSAAGSVALGYAWYRYRNSQKAATPGDDQLAYNATEEYLSQGQE